MAKDIVFRFLIVISVCFFGFDIGNSQDTLIRSILSQYSEIYSDPSGYLDGRRNTFIYPAASGNPWFMLTGAVQTVLETNKGIYRDLLLNYDILNDELILTFRDTSGMESIMINKNIIRGFNLFGSRFINMYSVLLPDPGFYEEVYRGKLNFYIKYKKTLIRQSGPVQYEYRYNIIKYLVKENKCWTISNNRSLYNALGDKKNEIRSFLRENQILVRSASNSELIRALRYYESF
jgi:hypothetical protein